MSRTTARVEWSLAEGEDFTASQYSRAHRWTFDGGVVVEASSSPSVVPLPWSSVAAVDPEEALVASVSACHMLWFLSLAAAGGHVVLNYADMASGQMGKDDRGRMAITRITLDPYIIFAPGKGPDAEALRALHHEAHEKCFIANSLRSEIAIAGL
jgi:organic hydroperoxide reductase OsmC/OhrA